MRRRAGKTVGSKWKSAFDKGKFRSAFYFFSAESKESKETQKKVVIQMIKSILNKS